MQEDLSSHQLSSTRIQGVHKAISTSLDSSNQDHIIIERCVYYLSNQNDIDEAGTGIPLEIKIPVILSVANSVGKDSEFSRSLESLWLPELPEFMSAAIKSQAQEARHEQTSMPESPRESVQSPKLVASSPQPIPDPPAQRKSLPVKILSFFSPRKRDSKRAQNESISTNEQSKSI
ncbi:MAG: hypothetical protein M3R00_04915 [Pseudomonadota bacterium]|nr:hypothetical protein [Pseudomonadota bacterium]